MDEEPQAPVAAPAAVTPTAAWRAEQEAKQAAYAARRRAWLRAIGHGAPPGRDEPEEDGPGGPGTAAAGAAGRSRRPRGAVHDPRQRRFEF